MSEPTAGDYAEARRRRRVASWDTDTDDETVLAEVIAELRRHQAAVQAVLDEADRLTVLGDDESADRIRAAVAALDPKEQDHA